MITKALFTLFLLNLLPASVLGASVYLIPSPDPKLSEEDAQTYQAKMNKLLIWCLGFFIADMALIDMSLITWMWGI